MSSVSDSKKPNLFSLVVLVHQIDWSIEAHPLSPWFPSPPSALLSRADRILELTPLQQIDSLRNCTKFPIQISWYSAVFSSRKTSLVDWSPASRNPYVLQCPIHSQQWRCRGELPIQLRIHLEHDFAGTANCIAKNLCHACNKHTATSRIKCVRCELL
jgi:hypothetical protein